MQRNISKGRESDRFITARSVERNKNLGKYLINDIPRPFSQPKNSNKKTLPMLTQGNSPTIKIYLSLLKNQLFPTSPFSPSHSYPNENTNTKHSSGMKSNHSQYMKGLLTKGGSSIVKNLNELCFKSMNKPERLLTQRQLQQKDYSQQIMTNSHQDTVNIRKYNSMINFTMDDSESESALNLLCKQKKLLSNTSYKRLDCPNLKDDFYLHLIDWSTKDTLAVGLDDRLFIYNTKTFNVDLASSLDYDSYTALCWRKDGDSLLIGTNDGLINLWDANKQVITNRFPHYSCRIDNITNMSLNPNVFTVGAQDNMIISYDIRYSQSKIMTFEGHTQEVCGLKWSHDDLRLASGGNDNKLIIWNGRTSSLEKRFNSHTSAIKAIDWSPYKYGYLLSGGGTQDRQIKLWNVNTMKLEESIETCSQVCNIAFSRISKEFVSTHGYTDNYILVWDASKMDVKTMLKGHRNRVLYMSQGPDMESIVTGAGDDSIRFWKVFTHDQPFPHNDYENSLSRNVNKIVDDHLDVLR